MVLVKDQDYHTVEEQFHEAVFTHASTSPNLQIIATLDVARRQMELEGYELVNRAIQLALDVRREVNSHPLISKYFRVLGVPEFGICRLSDPRRELGHSREGFEGR
jgi:arginine decarboxylase